LTQSILQTQADKFKKPIPDLRPGYTVRVHQKVKEGEKDRIQIFEGLVVKIHKGKCIADATFTVRRIVEGVGVEKIYPFCSPNIAKIDVVKVARVRRAVLSFLRGRRGKAARLSERFTTADEFAVAVAEEPKEEAEIEETPGAESNSAHSDEVRDETPQDKEL
jgi:large subunit ribosomal protein L19